MTTSVNVRIAKTLRKLADMLDEQRAQASAPASSSLRRHAAALSEVPVGFMPGAQVTTIEDYLARDNRGGTVAVEAMTLGTVVTSGLRGPTSILLPGGTKVLMPRKLLAPVMFAAATPAAAAPSDSTPGPDSVADAGSQV